MKNTNGLRQEVIEEMETLPADQLRNVLRFIESLRRSSRGAEENTSATHEEDSDVPLEEIRERLSTIEGSMAETVSNMREDRV
jgi:hypothetical protein